MITRIWHGRTKPEIADEYLEFLLTKGTDDYRKTEGNRSVRIWRKKEKEACHFWTVTEWESIEAVKAFAGEDFGKAKYYEFDKGRLLEFEEYVEHYEDYDVSSSSVRDFRRQLNRLMDGGSWQGESFSAKLADVTEEEAFRQPMPGVHSIAEIIWHCIYWKTVIVKRLEGDNDYRDRTMETMNFLPAEELKAKGWDTLKREFHGITSAFAGAPGFKGRFVPQGGVRGRAQLRLPDGRSSATRYLSPGTDRPGEENVERVAKPLSSGLVTHSSLNDSTGGWHALP